MGEEKRGGKIKKVTSNILKKHQLTDLLSHQRNIHQNFWNTIKKGIIVWRVLFKFGIQKAKEILLLKTPKIIPAQRHSAHTTFQRENSLEPDAGIHGSSLAPEQSDLIAMIVAMFGSSTSQRCWTLSCQPAEEAAGARAEPSRVTELRGLMRQGEMSAEETLKSGCQTDAESSECSPPNLHLKMY